MAIDIPDDLITLARAAAGEQTKALSAPYAPSGWGDWLDAAERFQSAVTAHASAASVNRVDVEMGAKRQAREG